MNEREMSVDRKLVNFSLGLCITINLANIVSHFFEWATPTREGVILDSVFIIILTAVVWRYFNKEEIY